MIKIHASQDANCYEAAICTSHPLPGWMARRWHWTTMYKISFMKRWLLLDGFDESTPP